MNNAVKYCRTRKYEYEICDFLLNALVNDEGSNGMKIPGIGKPVDFKATPLNNEKYLRRLSFAQPLF